jgi:hypothetical protein
MNHDTQAVSPQMNHDDDPPPQMNHDTQAVSPRMNHDDDPAPGMNHDDDPKPIVSEGKS